MDMDTKTIASILDDYYAHYGEALNGGHIASAAFQNLDSITDYNRIADGSTELIHKDGGKLILGLEHDDDGNIDGWTGTFYDEEGNDYATDGYSLDENEDIANLFNDIAITIVDWSH